ncbi:MFS transporter [Shewanella acanthi]|uniref:MFS transporter n=1 Tax=Shewanella acanthi TaxID=2864212 RepID=UPI001C655755|nr:MFS transporter [Shewanella acanthi]QYJ79377.1 MFS transporter [Shewanella acanthi]
MANPLRTFASLYSTTLLTVLAGGLLTTYLGLRLSVMDVPQLWIGGMMSAYYVGLVAGSKIGHRLIAQVGHIRAFVASAGIVAASALGHALIDELTIWIVLRLIVGMGMMCQYMVLESWLNEQADNTQRGTVFASYMIVSYFGLILGQGAISLYPDLGLEPLLLIAICFSLCIVPIAITRRIHPAPLVPAPLQITHYWRLAPQALTTVAIGSMIVGSFYGLAPAYASNLGMPPEEVATYMTVTIMAGLLAQWPMGKLSDIMSRSRLIRINCLLLGSLALVIAILPHQEHLSLVLTFLFGILGFTFYPLATALANSRVEQNERVGLSATILLTFGIGASIGPLIASTLMQWFGNNMLYGFISACTLVLFVRLRYVHSKQKAETHVTQDYIMATGDLVSSPLVAALDPRVDVESVKEQMVVTAEDENIDPDNFSDTDYEQQLAFSFDLDSLEATLDTPVSQDTTDDDVLGLTAVSYEQEDAIKAS